MPTRIQHGVDANCEQLEEDVHAASRSETLHNEEGKSFCLARTTDRILVLSPFLFNSSHTFF